MNHHDEKFREMLAGLTPEELAEDEHRLVKDTVRMGRLPLVKGMRQLIEEVGGIDPELEGLLSSAFDGIVTVLALWKRNEVGGHVALRKLYRLMKASQ